MSFGDAQDQSKNDETKKDETNENTDTTDQSASTSENKDQNQAPTITLEDGTVLDLEAATKKLNNQDQFINTLKGEAQEHVTTNEQLLKIAEKLDGAVGTTEGLKQLLDGITKNDTTDNSEAAAQQQPSIEEITESVRKTLKTEELETKRKSNMDAAMAAAADAYGADFATNVIDKGKELGYDLDGIDDLASNHPNAFMKLFIPAKKEDPAKPNTTSSSVSGVGQEDASQGKPARSFMTMNSKDKALEIKRRADELRKKYNQ